MLVILQALISVRRPLIIQIPAVSFLLNHNYNKILKSDWFSTALISALIGQFNRTVCVMPK